MTALPRRPRRPTGGNSAAYLILELAGRDTIEPTDAAQLLDLPIVRIEQVTLYRREYQLGNNALWIDATAIVGGAGETWRVLDLVPRDLSLAALRLDAAHEVHPCIKHTERGAIVVALEHHFAVRAGTLVVRTTGETSRVERVTVTTG